MLPTPAPCLGCDLTCPRRGNRRISRRQREKCVREGGALTHNPSSPSSISITPAIDPTYPCVHRSKESVSKVGCSKCGKNKTQLKVFACDSPEVDASFCTISCDGPKEYASCQKCEVRTIPGSVVDTIVAGVTTAPRKTDRLGQTLGSLANAGFDRVVVFSDDSAFSLEQSVEDIVRRDKAIGGWSNFYLGLTDLYHRYPTARLYAMFQDDILVSEGLADYLLKTVDNSYPVWSPFSAEANCLKKQGWQRIANGFGYNGAQAFVFTNEGVRLFLSDPEVVRYRRFPNVPPTVDLPNGKKSYQFVNDGKTHVDGVVGRYAKKVGKGVATHHPSLVEHVGDTSVMHPGAPIDSRWRSAEYSLGEKYPMNALPHVGCMMICGGSPDRKKFIRLSIEDFLKQNYVGEATLTIFDDHTESILETDDIGVLIEEHPYENRHVTYCHTSPRSVGAARQELLEFVQHQFPLLLQWDDDDRVSVDYLSYRVESCPPGAATILTRETIFFEDGRPDVLADFANDPGKFPGFPGTIMFPSCFAKSLKYPDQQRHEDTDVMRQLAKLTTLVCLKNDFDKYRRRVHSGSVSGLPHYEAMIHRIGRPADA